MNDLALMEPKDLVRQSTDIAGLCREIVLKTAIEIQKRKYVRVEGWMAIATAHGCVASAKDVERVDGGFRAIGEIRKLSDGSVVSTAEGFVGEDEPTWFGGEHTSWDYKTRQNVTKTLPKRPDYAIRAMAQTRAVSRACRSAFAHVVVLMDAGLSTTPAEEVPSGGFNDEAPATDAAIVHRESAREIAARQTNGGLTEIRPNMDNGDWRNAVIPFGKNKGVQLGELNSRQLEWYAGDWLISKQESSKPISEGDRVLVEALLQYKRTKEDGDEEKANKILRENQEAAENEPLPF